MEYYVTGFCKINNSKVVVNDEIIFDGQNDSLEDFILDQTGLRQNYPKVYKMDSLSRFGVIAAETFLRERILSKEYNEEEIAVVLSNYSSSLDTDVKYLKSTIDIPSPSLFVYTLPNIVTGEICIRHKLKGENAFFITKSFQPAFLAKYVEILLETTKTEACLCGWVEVLGDNRDVFLYLVEKKKSQYAFSHSPSELLIKYREE